MSLVFVGLVVRKVVVEPGFVSNKTAQEGFSVVCVMNWKLFFGLLSRLLRRD
jgi:hypothetical protein